MNCTLLSYDDAVRLYSTVLAADFPPEELRPLSWVNPLMADGAYRAYLLCDGEVPVAYAFLCKSPSENICLVDYLAVFAPYRGRGMGTALLAALRSESSAADALLFEVDHPDFSDSVAERIKRERRISFYRRCGAIDTGVRTCVSGCEFQILCLPRAESLHSGDPAAALDGIYRFMFPPEFYKTQVMFRRPTASSAVNCGLMQGQEKEFRVSAPFFAD